MKRRMCLAQLGLHGVLAVAPRVEGKGSMGRGGQRRRREQEREEDGEKKGRRGERRIKLGKMGEWTDRQSRQAGSQIPPNAPTQPPRAQLMAPKLSFARKYTDGLLKTEPIEASLPQPQSLPPCQEWTSLPLQAWGCSWGTGKEGELGWGGGRLWGPHECVKSQGSFSLTILPGPLTPGPEALPPPPRPRLALGVLPQLLLMTCSWRSALSARSRSSSMNCCSRSLALASRAAVSFRNWSICTTSLGREQSLTPGSRV